eukprot:jgi/Botrbrau1/14562/Bobra.27_3s0003.2
MSIRSNIKSEGTLKPSLERRRLESQAISEKKRATILYAKRMRLEADVEQGDEAMVPDVASLVEELNTTLRWNLPPSMDTIRDMRRYVSLGSEAGEQAIAAGVVPTLSHVLQLRHTGDVALTETQVEAAWALTNLAAAAGAMPESVLQAAPALVACLGPSNPSILSQQAAWALGNLAAERGRAPTHIAGLGGIRALAGLMGRGSDPLDTAPSAGAASLAAWALYVIALSLPSKVGAVVLARENCHHLRKLLEAEGDAPDLVAEVLWLLTALSAHGVHVPVPLLHTAEPLAAVMRLLACLPERSLSQEAPMQYAVPLVRLVGHVTAAAATPQEQADLLKSGLERGIPALLWCCIAPGGTEGLVAEAAWALSNIAGFDGRRGVDLILSAGGFPTAVALVGRAGISQREGLSLLANLLAGGGGGTGEAEVVKGALTERRDLQDLLIPLLASPDLELAGLALQVLEMVFRCAFQQEGLSCSPPLVAALRSLVNRDSGYPMDDKLKRMAAALLLPLEQQPINSNIPGSAAYL